MISRYINGDLAIKDIQETYCKPCKKSGDDYHGVKCRACFAGDCIDVIERQPEEDVISVVYCRECDFGKTVFGIPICMQTYQLHPNTWYCPNGIKRLSNENEAKEQENK